MKHKLQSLFLLQLLDTELDELRELRGDLPETVRQLEERVNEFRTKIEECESALRIGAAERVRKEKESLELIDKIEKYKGQQLQVQNNKEYDALTREIDNAESTIMVYEAEIELFTSEAVDIRKKKEDLEAQLTGLAAELDEKITELKEVLTVTAEEEQDFAAQRDEALKSVQTIDFELYTRIRNAKGKAIAPVRRGSCSGCYNIVPPQLILEVKKNDKLYTCEHCGRILISEELASAIKLKKR